MTRPHSASRPPSLAATVTLEHLGANIGAAIKVRESYARFAQRIGVSRPTLRKLISGEPGVTLGTLVRTLDALGMLDQLHTLAAPEHDTLGQSLRLGSEPKGTGFKMDLDF